MVKTLAASRTGSFARYCTVPAESERTESGIDDPDHSDSDQKDLVQVNSSRRGPEQNVRTLLERSDPVHHRDEERHLEEDQEYTLRGKEYLGRLV